MTAGPTYEYPQIAREETRTLFAQTMGLVALTAGVFALGAYAGRNISPGWALVMFIPAIVCLIGLNIGVRRSEQLAIGLLFGFGAFMGLASAPTLAQYASANPDALWQAGGATALFMAAFGAVGYATRRDLSPYARVFFFALLGLIVFGIVLLFVSIPNGYLIYSILGLVIFAGLTIFDFNRLRRSTDMRSAPLIAASIFLDAINVFFFFLSLFGGSRD
jgi:FtsH-binding integral membrane protein